MTVQVAFPGDGHSCGLNVARRSPDLPPSSLTRFRFCVVEWVSSAAPYMCSYSLLSSVPMHRLPRVPMAGTDPIARSFRPRSGRILAEDARGARTRSRKTEFISDCTALCPHGGGLAGEADAGETIPCVCMCVHNVLNGLSSNERLRGLESTYEGTVHTVWYGPRS